VPYSSTPSDEVLSRTVTKVVLFWVQSTLVWLGWLRWVSSKWAESAARKYSMLREICSVNQRMRHPFPLAYFPFERRAKHRPFLICCTVFIIIALLYRFLTQLVRLCPGKRTLGSSFLLATCSGKKKSSYITERCTR